MAEIRERVGSPDRAEITELGRDQGAQGIKTAPAGGALDEAAELVGAGDPDRAGRVSGHRADIAAAGNIDVRHVSPSSSSARCWLPNTVVPLLFSTAHPTCS